MSYVKNASDEIKIDDNKLDDNFKKSINVCNSSITTETKKEEINENIYGKNNKKLKNKGGFKNIVHKVMSWNSSRTSNGEEHNKTDENIGENLSQNIKNLKLPQDDSDDNLCRVDWLRAKDSLENLLINREMNATELVTSKSASMPFRKFNESPTHSNTVEPTLKNHKNASAHSISKVLAWDPWDTLGRRNKRENKRRKEKSLKESPTPLTLIVNDNIRKDVTSGDENRERVLVDNNVEDDNEENYENYQYQPYHPKNVKSVNFTNEVNVVYFNADEVVGESKEPLKKELEQQIRNKEMRKGHCPTMMVINKRTENYLLSPLFKK